jgi:hypothetical protein
MHGNNSHFGVVTLPGRQVVDPQTRQIAERRNEIEIEIQTATRNT